MVHVVVACRALLVLVFLVSAAGKLRGRGAFDGFVAEVRAWRLVPAGTARGVAVGVAGVEAALPVLLVVPVTARPGLAVAGLLLVALTAGVVVTRRRGTVARCACFGRTATVLGRRHVVRNVLLVGAVAVASLPAAGPVGAAALTVAIGAGALGALLVTTLDDIAGLFSPLPDVPSRSL
ncbi:MauE/DoxX family redox-associated membrane protein [Streptomyces filamentosus]|uniref:MauE/DoxX family redox-associated membrane protein n=1 Tax=Streptomyces filamentosus TaxID=67294 RepID=UPI00332CCF22